MGIHNQEYRTSPNTKRKQIEDIPRMLADCLEEYLSLRYNRFFSSIKLKALTAN